MQLQSRASVAAEVRGGLRAAASRIDITPTRPLDMASGPRAAHVRASDRVDEPLEADILALRYGDAQDDVLLFVTLDLLYVGATLERIVMEAAPSLSPAQILVAASHTHRAPVTQPGLDSLGRTDPDFLSDLAERLTTEIVRVLSPSAAVPVTIRVGEAMAAHSINRRLRKKFFLAKKPQWNIIANAPNPAGATDETVTALELRGADGEPVAYMWNYACHPVSHPDARSYSSHFPYVVRSALRSGSGAVVPVLFLQGFSGNTRPSASSRVRSPREIVRRIVSGPLFDDMSPRAYRQWASSLSDVVRGALEAGRTVEPHHIEARREDRSGDGFAEGSRPLSFRSVRLGADLAIVGMSAEPVAEYARLVRSWQLSATTMCVGCVGDVAGYVPTDQMIIDGGYESDRSRSHFGVGSYVADYETNIVASLRAVTTAESS